jgi:hypothetical protein
MHRWLIGGVVVSAAAVWTLSGPADGLAQKGKGRPGPWLNNYPAARNLARQTGKPIFLVFR